MCDGRGTEGSCTDTKLALFRLTGGPPSVCMALGYDKALFSATEWLGTSRVVIADLVERAVVRFDTDWAGCRLGMAPLSAHGATWT